MRDYYNILDVSQDATAEEIRLAYRFHIKAFHPDKFAPGTDHARNAHRRTQEIIEAYDVLSKPHFRAEYDLFRKCEKLESSVLSSETFKAGREDEAPRSRSFRFRSPRTGEAILQLRAFGPIAAVIIVFIFAWFQRNHQRQIYNATSRVRNALTAAPPGFLSSTAPSPAALVTRALPVARISGKLDTLSDVPKDSTFGVTEPGRIAEFEASREAHVAWELEQKRDYPNAVRLYQDAVAYGNPDAETNLAKLYLRGKGVQRDDNKARALLEKAASQGHEEAQRILKAISSHLTP
jgi:curved DNA-binding protein CbpA